GEIRVTRLNTSDGYYSAHNKGMNIPPERHEHFETVITLKNNYIHTVNGVSFQPQVGDAVILRPQDCHSARAIDDSAEHICQDIYIDQQLFKQACDYISPTLFVKIMTRKNPPSFHLNEKELASFSESVDFSYLYSMATDYEIYKSVKRIVACTVIGTYVKKSFESDKPLPECLTKLLMNLHYDTSYKKSVCETAKEIGYSPDYMNRLFKEYFGKSIEQHIIECKIYDSLTLLLQTDMQINGIAEKMGWECTGNYINHFKKIYGVTPAKYRKEMKDKII
ncbi:MAG: AraC family transcriptional regulator, partial [Clostridia bacterium]|nr:AraC family transcriptional regulator [Clostridia bacterium]